MHRRLVLVGAVAALLISVASPVAAKGRVSERGYALVEGPGLAHPIVISAPWSPRGKPC